jgi:hypothetical protein
MALRLPIDELLAEAAKRLDRPVTPTLIGVPGDVEERGRVV